MYLREYETIYILRPDLSDEESVQLNQKLSDILDKQGAKVLKQNAWGKKKLAYEIKKQPKGYYLTLNYLSEGPVVREFERNLKILDPVLKFQTIRVAENVDVDQRLAEQEAQNQAQAIIDAKRQAESEARAKEIAARQAAEEAAQQAAKKQAAAVDTDPSPVADEAPAESTEEG